MQSVNNSKIQFTENYFSSHGRHTLSLSYTYITSLSMINLEAHSSENGYMKGKWRGAL